MELKKGFKQTEVGIIPEDWNVRPSAEVCLKIQDGTHFSPSLGGNDNLYVTSKNIGFGILDVSDADRIDASQHKAIYSRCDVRKGDLLLTKDGANTGNAALNNLDEEISLLSSVAFLRFDPKHHIASYYLQQILSPNGQKRIKELMAGNAITRLTLERIRKFRFAVPPLPEQLAIAAALSDVDALLIALDELIAKKRAIKQGAMQELLTGKKRLPGFRGEGEVKKLGEIAETLKGSGLSKNKLTESGSRKCILYGELFTTYGRIINEVVSSTDSPNGVLSKRGDVLMPGSTTTIGIDLAIASALMLDNILLGGDINIIRSKKTASYSPEYLVNYITYVKRNSIAELAQGITIIHLYGKDLRDLDIELPKVEEQEAIASILSDMDTEIAALEQKREKTRLLKQGIMQELLTGKTRLL